MDQYLKVHSNKVRELEMERSHTKMGITTTASGKMMSIQVKDNFHTMCMKVELKTNLYKST